MQGALDLDLGSVAGKGYIRVGVLVGGKRVAHEAGGTGPNQSCWGSVSANKTWEVFDSSCWSMVGVGYFGVGGLGGGKQVACESGGYRSKN